jgi:uncharacterized MAPEG superfamily protein
MTMDLWMVVGSVALTWALIMLEATLTILRGRVLRASNNMKENLPLFVAIVLVVQAAGLANGTSALGAEIFLGARVLHAIVYIAGVPFVRTGVWLVSIAGIVLVGSALF